MSDLHRFAVFTQHGSSDHATLAEAVGVMSSQLQATSWRPAYKWVRLEFWTLLDGIYNSTRDVTFRSHAELVEFWKREGA